MLPASLATQTVTRLRAVESTDEYGNPVTDWTTPDELPISGCSVQPQPAAEFTDTREEALSRWQLWAPSGSDIAHTDRIQHKDRVYLIDGDVQDWDQLSLDHVTCLLRLLTED